MTSHASIIQLADVAFAYPGMASPALAGISLEVRRGEHVCIVGPNGSGKSTLAQVVNGLLTPSAGSMRIGGIDPANSAESALEARRMVATVFQHPEDQMVTSVVADDVAFGPENLGLPRGEITRRVRASLAAVGIESLAQADPADLSGGQRQCVAIAGALAMDPQVLVLDEPTSMLDAPGRAAVRSTIERLRERGITIVHITHDVDEALAADRVVALNGGRIAWEGTPDQLVRTPTLFAELGLDEPHTVDLARQLEARGFRLPHTIDAQLLCEALADEFRARRVSTAAPTPQKSRGHDASQPAEPALSFSQASYTYVDPPHRRLLPFIHREAPRVPYAIDCVSLALEPGTVTALMGRTGAGKSTLAELACALKLPCAGDVRVQGASTADRAARSRVRRAIGYVGQFPERQLFAATVREDVAYGPTNLGIAAGDELDWLVRDALRACGLEPTDELLGRSPHQLSGGQRRAVALAGVLAMQQPILVLDEPMAGLDPAGRDRMRRLIVRLRTEGATLLLITHSADDAALLADRVAVLDRGRLVAHGPARDILRDPRITLPQNDGLGLGEPWALGFERALAARGIDLPAAPLTVDELVEEVIRYGTAHQPR